MSDYGTRARESVERQVELRLQYTYTKAQKDILKKLDEFTSKYKEKDKIKRKQVEDGEISEDDYKRWVAGQVFQGAQWEEKVKDITDTLNDIRKDDLKMIHDREIDVFATNANYQQYKLEHDIGKNFGFDLYDEDAVRNLIEKKPALLPEKIVDKKKHNHWNQGIIANSITQGIIQGESIPKIAARIANTTANHNLKASTLYARTAMTCAQNSGRMEMLRQSKEMGIDVKKKWLATRDKRTRDSHIHLDGQIAEVEKPFKSDFGNIDFPGDPKAFPGDVYNCRCTLVYVYPEYENYGKDELAEFEPFDEAKDMTYEEWETAKRGAAKRIITEEDRIRRKNELMEMEELAEKYEIEGDIEDQLVAARLADEVIKNSGYNLPESSWSGKVLPYTKDDEFDGDYDMDTHDIRLRKDSWFETSIHEQLHSRSRGLNFDDYLRNINIEEACVETLTRDISSRLGVYTSTVHRDEIEAFRQIAELTEMTPAQLAAELLDVELTKRYNLLEDIVDKYEKTGEATPVEMKLFRRQLRIFKGN